jgi:hypothetical protein
MLRRTMATEDQIQAYVGNALNRRMPIFDETNFQPALEEDLTRHE